MQPIMLKEITRVYRFGTQARSWERKKAVNDHFIAYKLHGLTMHEADGQSLPFDRDMVMVANSEDLYRVTRHDIDGEGIRGGCIAIHFTTVEAFPLHMAVYDCASQPQMKSEFYRMLDAWNQYQTARHPAAQYACMACFYSILSRLLLLADKSTVQSDDKLAQAREYLERNCADSTLSIAQAAANAGLGQRRVGELFQNRYHQTPGKYLTDCRMAAAVKLLSQTQLSIAEIAALTGYSSASYFIRVFKQEMGIAPNAYRLQGFCK